MGQHDAPEQQRDHFLSNKVYDVLKFIAQILLPALGTLYFALAAIWGLPSAEEVNGSVLAVDAFLGVILGLSSTSYKNSDARFDGVINSEVQPDTGKTVASFEVQGDPFAILKKNEVTFKVNAPEDQQTP